MDKIQAKENLSKLIDKFEKEKSAGLVQEYNEEATKTAFIQPFLKDVLGWNVSDRNEVSPEEKVSRGRVDYGIKVEGKIKLFVEAKPIKADLNKHIEQAVRYGYNRRDVPFVLLTDFEGIKLFDVTVKPDSRNLLKGLKIDLQWNEYLQKFDKLWMLSKESVLHEGFNKLLLIKPKERLPVDKAILNDLKGWREMLAKDIYKNNPKLFHSGDPEKDANYLKEINQKILDRIIFMRSCEDRNLIHRRLLKQLFEERTDTVGTDTMVFLREEFKDYYRIFDSDLFKFQEWDDNLAIDFKVMKNIILDTCNPYQFDVIPLEVLGNIYEQYLGYTIRLTEHQVKYELKPDVRKAGGVYYTPEYIVDYIVKNTVGKLLQELSPKKIKTLRILDPACGSGSFLIRAYEEMLNYYRNQKKPTRAKRPGTTEEQEKLDMEHEETARRLTIQEKSEILRNHIFGVDIDEQAVEVTKLSLMLKMLEGEYGFVPGRAVLPMLEGNIKCGNSLISGDTLELKKYFGDDWYKVKPFNWNERFRKIMVDEGGFDIVIGNPPYVTAEIKDNEREYYKNKYPESTIGKLNTYRLFTHIGWILLKKGGLFGFIIPNTYLTDRDSQKLRNFLLTNSRLKQILFFPEKLKIFENVTQATTILNFEKEESRIKDNIINVKIIASVKNIKSIDDNYGEDYKQSLFMEMPEQMIVIRRTAEQIKIIKKIMNSAKPLESFADIYQGEVNVSINKDFIADKRKNKNYMPLIRGNNIGRYYVDLSFSDRKGSWVDTSKPFRNHQNIPRIVTQEVSNMQQKRRLNGVFIDKKVYVGHTANYILIKNKECSPYFIIALLNSYLLDFIFQTFNSTNHIPARELKRLPICEIDFSDPKEKKLHDDLVALVDVMLNLNKKLQTAKGSEKDQIQRQIEKTDNEIDQLVYKLYGLTKEEIKIIEESTRG